MTWAFSLIIRNTLIMHCKELKISTESVAMSLKWSIDTISVATIDAIFNLCNSSLMASCVSQV
jgi:hypothetical protein